MGDVPAGNKGGFGGDGELREMGSRVFFLLGLKPARTHATKGNGIGDDCLPTPRTTTTVLHPPFVGGEKKQNKN